MFNPKKRECGQDGYKMVEKPSKHAYSYCHVYSLASSIETYFLKRDINEAVKNHDILASQLKMEALSGEKAGKIFSNYTLNP